MKIKSRRLRDQRGDVVGIAFDKVTIRHAAFREAMARDLQQIPVDVHCNATWRAIFAI